MNSRSNGSHRAFAGLSWFAFWHFHFLPVLVKGEVEGIPDRDQHQREYAVVAQVETRKSKHTIAGGILWIIDKLQTAPLLVFIIGGTISLVAYSVDLKFNLAGLHRVPWVLHSPYILSHRAGGPLAGAQQAPVT